MPNQSAETTEPKEPDEPSRTALAGNGIAAPPYNRIGLALRHGTRYAFLPQARLAQDVGCARSTISRLVAGKTRPSLALVQRVADALSRDLGVPLPLGELFSLDGTYPTRSGCALCGCGGCFPEEAYDRRGNLKPAFRHQRPGDWSLADVAPSSGRRGSGRSTSQSPRSPRESAFGYLTA